MNQQVVFTGLDLDTSATSPEWMPGSYRYALNVHIGSSEKGNVGAVENLKGNTLVSTLLPTGTNKVIGSFEDRQNNRAIYCLYNSNGDHGIYYFDANTSSINRLFEWDGLNFQQDKLITGLSLVGGILQFTDNHNPQRMLDLNNVATYPLPYTEEMVSLIKRPCNRPPLVQRKKDATYTSNYILKKTFQFATRIVYLDNSKSKLSPYSKLSASILLGSIENVSITISGSTYTGQRQKVSPDDNNYIEVNLNIADLISTNMVYAVSKIEVLVKEGNTGDFNVFTTLDRSEFMSSQIVRFYNDTNLIAVDQSEINENFDSVPLKSAAHGIIKNRGYWGGNTEGFDVENDLTAAITPVYTNIYQTVSTPNPAVIPVTTSLLGAMVFKDRGVFNLGIVWHDKFNRSCGVQTGDSFKIRINANSDNTFSKVCTALQLSISGSIPEWAHYYSIVRTKNLNQAFFQQIRITDVSHLESYDGSGNAVYKTSYASGDIFLATHLGFNAGKYSNISYTYSEGDRLRVFYVDSTGNDYEADLPIKGVFYGTTLATTVNKIVGPTPKRGFEGSDAGRETIQQQVGVAKIIIDTFDFKSGITFAEIYNPTVQDGLYYEIGETYPIINAGTPSRAFSQTSFTLDRGDVYFTLRALDRGQYRRSNPAVYYLNYIPTESLGLFDEFFDVSNSDIGRVYLEIPDEKQVLKETGIRFSNKWIEGTKINGFSTFLGLNEKILPAEYGPIYKLQIAYNTVADGNVLLSIHSKETVSLYIEEALFRDLEGKTTVGLSNEIIGASIPLKGSLGTINPESIVQHDRVVYGWDANKGVVWRYSADGLTPISNFKMKNYFSDMSRSILPFDSARAHGAFDPYFGEYILTFDSGDGTVQETIAFNENINRWTSFYSFIPENYQKINTNLISFKGGNVYIHGSNSTHGNFYGEQYTFKITPVCNILPTKSKILQTVGTEGKDVWVATKITNPKGQESELILSDYQAFEDGYSASVLCDKNTPNIDLPQIPLLHGDVMRDVEFDVEMECSVTTNTVLRSAFFRVIASEVS